METEQGYEARLEAVNAELAKDTQKRQGLLELLKAVGVNVEAEQ